MTGPSAEQKNRTWMVRAGIGAAAAVVIVGIGVALVALLGRPAVSMSSGEALVQVHLGGVGTEVTGIRATSAGRPLALARQSTGFVPVAALPQGRTVHVRVTAAPPSWLRWLLGSGVSTSATLRAPSAAPSARGGRRRAPGAGNARLRPPGERHRLPGGQWAGPGHPAQSALDHGPAGRAGAPVGRRASGGGRGMAVGAPGRPVDHGGLARGAAGRRAGSSSGSGSGQRARRARQPDHPDLRRAGGQGPRYGPPASLANHSGNLDRAGSRHAGVHPAGPRLRTWHRGKSLV